MEVNEYEKANGKKFFSERAPRENHCQIIRYIYLFSPVEADDIPKIEYIYNKYHRDMMRLAKHRLKKAKITSYATEAEDVVQNAFNRFNVGSDSLSGSMQMYTSFIDLNIHPPRTENETKKTVVHELGHALGYKGHSPTATDVMYSGSHSQFILSSNETNHLYQIYTLMN